VNIGAPKAVWIGAGRVLRNWRLLVLVYILNLCFAAVLTLPFAAVLTKDISRSLAGSDLLSGFNYRWYVGFVNANGTYFDSLVPQIFLLFALYVVMEAFLAGGFYSGYSSRSRTKGSTFYSASASRFFPILAVTIAEVALLFLLYRGDAAWASGGADAVRRALTDYQVFRAAIWRYAVVAAVFFAVNVLSDFVKAAVSIDDDTFTSKLRRGFSFVAKHPLSSMGVYLGGTVLSGAIIASYFVIGLNSHAVDEAGILAELAAGQIFILLRIFSKLIFYAGEAVLYKESQIEVIKVKPEMLE
jgi:hypothetical protein